MGQKSYDKLGLAENDEFETVIRAESEEDSNSDPINSEEER